MVDNMDIFRMTRRVASKPYTATVSKGLKSASITSSAYWFMKNECADLRIAASSAGGPISPSLNLGSFIGRYSALYSSLGHAGQSENS